MNEAAFTPYYQVQTDAFLRMFIAADHKGKLTEKELAERSKKLEQIFDHQLSRFGLPPEQLTDHERRFGLLHPVVIGEEMIKALGFNETDHQKLSEILGKSYPVDPTTGYFTKQCGPTIIGLTHLAAQRHPPVCLIEGDLANMGGCNIALGEEGTDKLLHEICRIVKERFTSTPEDRLAGKVKEVQCVRAGGDELRLVVYGMTEREINKILREEIHPQINLLAAKYGVHQVPHTKEGRLPGFGAAFACVDLATEKSISTLDMELSSSLETQKYQDAALRYGLIDNAAKNKYVTEIYSPYMQKNIRGSEYSKDIDRVFKSLESGVIGTNKHWQKLIGLHGAYHDLNLRYGCTNPRDFFDHYWEEHKTARAANLDTIIVPKTEHIAERIPFWNKAVTEQYDEAPEILRLRMALKAFGFTRAAEAKEIVTWNTKRRRYEFNEELREQDPDRKRLQDLIIDLMSAFDAQDPAIHCKTSNFLLPDAKIYFARHDGMRVMNFEVTNLTGLNNVSPALADAVLRETAKYIQRAFTQPPADINSHLADHIYYEGNGKFKVLLPPTHHNQPEAITTVIKNAEASIKRNVETNIFAKPIAEFALNTYAQKSGGREAESKEKLDILKARLTQLSKSRHKPIVYMTSIPHPKDHNKSLSLVSYEGSIALGESVESGIKRINGATEKRVHSAQEGVNL